MPELITCFSHSLLQMLTKSWCVSSCRPQQTEVCLRFVLSVPLTLLFASSREGSAEQGISSCFPEGNKSTLHCASAGSYQHGFPSSGPGGNQNCIKLCKGNKDLLFIALHQGFFFDLTHYWKNNNLEEIVFSAAPVLLCWLGGSAELYVQLLTSGKHPCPRLLLLFSSLAIAAEEVPGRFNINGRQVLLLDYSLA